MHNKVYYLCKYTKEQNMKLPIIYILLSTEDIDNITYNKITNELKNSKDDEIWILTDIKFINTNEINIKTYPYFISLKIKIDKGNFKKYETKINATFYLYTVVDYKCSKYEFKFNIEEKASYYMLCKHLVNKDV